MSRTAMREVRVGVVVVLALAGLLGFVALAGGGPGYLTARREIDVIFRDGQGVRPGAPVRVAGIDAGRVIGVDLKEIGGVLQARVRMTMPEDVAARLRQDVKVTIQASLTGSACLNVVSSGRSEVALVPGQMVQGVESSFFDPVLEQVGLGPVERSHISHTIGELRSMVDAAGPRLNQTMSALQTTVTNLQQTTEVVQPAVTETASRIEEIARRLDTARLEQSFDRVEALVENVDAIIAENRPVIQKTIVGVNDLTADVRTLLADEKPRVDALLHNFDGTRARLDAVLDQSRIITTHGAEVMTQNRANLERTLANVKDATDYGVRLVQKLYGNPFYLSPFYKPTREDVAAQEMYDQANTILLATKELSDTVNRMEAMRSGKTINEMTQQELASYNALYKHAAVLMQNVEQMNSRLATSIGTATPPTRRR